MVLLMHRRINILNRLTIANRNSSIFNRMGYINNESRKLIFSYCGSLFFNSLFSYINRIWLKSTTKTRYMILKKISFEKSALHVKNMTRMVPILGRYTYVIIIFHRVFSFLLLCHKSYHLKYTYRGYIIISR